MPIQRSREYGGARLLVHRHRLAGDRRLVHARPPVRHLAVHGDLLAGTHENHLADLDLRRRNARLLSAADHRGLGGREIHQRLDRVARAIHGVGFEQLSDREQEQRRRRFRLLANDPRARGGDRHEKVHVECAVHRGPQAARHDEPSSRDGGEPEERDRCDTRGTELTSEQCEPEPHASDRGHEQPATPLPERRRWHALALRARGHAELRHAALNFRRRDRALDDEPVADQIELQLRHSGQVPQLALDEPDLVGAVHAADDEGVASRVAVLDLISDSPDRPGEITARKLALGVSHPDSAAHDVDVDIVDTLELLERALDRARAARAVHAAHAELARGRRRRAAVGVR